MDITTGLEQMKARLLKWQSFEKRGITSIYLELFVRDFMEVSS